MTKEEKIAELINIRDNFNYTLAPREVFDDAIKALKQEPRKGYWKIVPYEDTYYCSECNLRLDDEQTYIPLNYCPKCGAKMDIDKRIKESEE